MCIKVFIYNIISLFSKFFTVFWVGLQKHPWIPLRRSPPLLWSGTVEAARGPVPVPELTYKCTSISSPPPKNQQQFTFHLGQSLLKLSVYKQGGKVVRAPWNRYVSELTCQSSVMTPDLVTSLQGFCLSTLACLAWRQPTFPFGILPHTCLTWKKTFKSASESGRWETNGRQVTSITPSEVIIALTDPTEFLKKVKKMAS